MGLIYREKIQIFNSASFAARTNQSHDKEGTNKKVIHVQLQFNAGLAISLDILYWINGHACHQITYLLSGAAYLCMPCMPGHALTFENCKARAAPAYYSSI